MASANFYNNSAMMIGVDLHHAQLPPTSLSEIATGHRQDDWPYLVLVSHSWFGGDDGKRTPKVTADGLKMIRDGFTIGKVPHVTPVLHPYEVVVNAQIVLDSKTTPLLKMASVTSAGDPLAVCAIVSVGANLNCQDGGMKLTGIVACTCSVKTSPQLKDFLFRIFDDYFKKMLNKWLTGLFELLLKSRGVPWPVRPILVWVFKKVIAKVVDWLEGLTKWLWDQAEKQAKEPSKLPEPKKEEPKLPEPKKEPKQKTPEDLVREKRDKEERREQARRKQQWEHERPSWYPEGLDPPPWF